MDKKLNLIPFNIMDKKTHYELSKKGGIMSGIARQKKAEAKYKQEQESLTDLYQSLELVELLKSYKKIYQELLDTQERLLICQIELRNLKRELSENRSSTNGSIHE